MAVASGVLGVDDVNDVFESCKVLSAKWDTIGLKLGLHQYTLDIIKRDNPGDSMLCMLSMLNHWLKRESDKQPIPTWEALCLGLTDVDRVIALRIAMEHKCRIQDAEKQEAMSFKKDSLCQVCGCGECTVKDWRQGKPCLSPIWEEYPDFILLDPQKNILSPKPLRKQNRLYGETKELVGMFKKCSELTWRCLVKEIKGVGPKRKLNVDDIVTTLCIEFDLPSSQTSTVAELCGIFSKLRASWFNFKPFYFVAERYLSAKYPEVMEMWSNYFAAFAKYCKDRKISECADILFNEEADDNIFILTVDEMYNNMKLSDISSLRNSLCLVLGVPSVSVHLVTVRVKSVHLHFVYCLDDYITRFTLTANQKEQLAALSNIKITSLADSKKRFLYDFNVRSEVGLSSVEAKKVASHKLSSSQRSQEEQERGVWRERLWLMLWLCLLVLFVLVMSVLLSEKWVELLLGKPVLVVPLWPLRVLMQWLMQWLVPPHWELLLVLPVLPLLLVLVRSLLERARRLEARRLERLRLELERRELRRRLEREREEEAERERLQRREEEWLLKQPMQLFTGIGESCPKAMEQRPELNDLKSLLGSVEWHSLGESLSIDSNILESFLKTKSNEDKLREMVLSKWLQSSSGDVTWDTVLRALRRLGLVKEMKAVKEHLQRTEKN